jgi:hypothetical protein
MLIGHWPLTGNTNDYSGYNNNGTPTNITYTTGKIGQAASFNGTSSYFTVNNTITQGADFSFSAWVRTTTTANQNIVSCRTETGGGFSIFLLAGVVRFDSGANFQWTTNYTMPTNQWVHLTVTKNSSIRKLFINGALTNSIASGGDMLTLFSLMSFGASQASGSGYANFLNGNLNDIRIFNHTLSDYEVKELAKAKVLHYTFDDPYEEPTVNLVPTPLTFTNTTTTWGARETVTVTYGQTDPFGGTNAVLITPNSTTDNYFGSRNTSLGIGTYTTSLWLKATKNTTLRIRTGTGNTAGAFIDYTANLTTAWQRFEYTGTTTVDPSHMLHLGGWSTWTDNTFSVYFAFPQIEAKGNSTPFVDGTRNIGIRDSSGYGNNGTVVLETSPRFSTARIGSGSGYFSASAIIQHPNPFLGQNNLEQEWSVSAWVKMDDNTTTQMLNNFNSGNYVKYGASNALLYLNGGANDYYTYSTNIPSGSWQHVVFVFKNSSGLRRIYLNGNNISTSGPNNTSTPSGIPATVTVATNLRGNIDDYRIYATALSDADVLALYNRRANFDNLGNAQVNELNEYTNFDYTINQNNLVLNGSAELQNNTNFTGFVYDPSFVGFSRTSGGATLLLDEFIPINGNGIDVFDRYVLSGEFRQPTGTMSRYFFMIACYDKNKQFIENRFVTETTTAARTTLSQNLNNGDTFVNLTSNINSWSATGAGVYHFSQQFAIFPNGHDYPDYTYSRIAGQYTVRDTTNSRLQLTTPWAGGFMPAGSRIMNTTDGGTFSYIAAGNALMTPEFILRTATTTSTQNDGSMRAGSVYVKVGFLINRDAGTVTTNIRNIKFYNIDDPTQGFFLSTNGNLINSNGQALFTNINEYTGTQNTGAQQEITYNGTLLINGEFSEVD